jgi:UDP:flavonoid glycosyltransferase YjiC (YdhE family)
VVKAEAPDLLIFDGMFPAALAQAKDFGLPTVAVSHTFVFRMLDRWRGTVNTLIGMRQQAGLGSLPDLDALWHGCDRVLVTTLAEFDAAPLPGWGNLHHVGPVLEDEKVAVPTELPWRADDKTPLALMSFSTGFEQRSLDKLQRGLDAVADLPLHLVATTGGIVDPAELKAPRNAFVVNYAAHDPIIAKAALVITHGGHGTAMRALKYGVPMIVMPGLAHDQAVIAALMEEWGCGIAMPGDVAFGSAGNAVTVSREEAVAALRAAAEKILATPSYRANAKKRAAMLAGVDGAANAAREIETLLC